MPTFSPATDQSDIELPEPGKYILTLLDLTDAPAKQFGPGLKWTYKMVDPESGVTIQSRDGGDYELWQFTSVKLSPKSRARPFVESLLGRPLDTANREQPDVRQLIGRSMLGIVIHERREDGSDKAVVTSCKPYVAPATSAVAAPHRTPPPPATEDALKAAVKAAIRKAEILGSGKHLDWLAYEPDGMTQADLEQLLAAVQHDILAG